MMLAIFGGSGVAAFAGTMLIGLVVGTYSSIFIASPVLLWFKDKAKVVEGQNIGNEDEEERPDDAYANEPAFT